MIDISVSDCIKIYFGFAEDPRPVEGWFSPAHLAYVTVMILITVGLAILLGRKYRNSEYKEKRKVLRIATVLILGSEITKITICCFIAHNFLEILSNLPLFLCSIHLLALPFAAFGKGRIRDACTDFVLIFGTLGCLAGTYLAGNIFGGSPVLSFFPMVSVTTHCISGFAGLYSAITGLASMKAKNRPIVTGILVIFEFLAAAANFFLNPENGFGLDYQHNYMFFSSPDGTPFSIVFDMVGGDPTLYGVAVALLYIIYLMIFSLIWSLCTKKSVKKQYN